MRINKFLAECGVASRRGCDKIISEGRVKVGGKTTTELGIDIKNGATVTVDGKTVCKKNEYLYIMLNKPKGYVCTVKDDLGRKTVLDLIHDNDKKDFRLFPIGRLDYDTEGLLILTNDGDLSQRLTHPSNEIPKTYVAKIEGAISETELESLRTGIVIDGNKTKKARVRLLEFFENTSRVELTISEGRNRQVRRMFEALNKQVVFLKRMAIGDLKIGSIDRGKYKKLNDDEVYYLKNL
jgi:pseudouridine synthase